MHLHKTTLQLFDGNMVEDKDEGVVRNLPKVALAKAVRIVPQSWDNAISMRFEVYGCPWGNCHRVFGQNFKKTFV